MKQDSDKPFIERRVALEKRRRVAELSPEEMRRELLTSAVTGLPNRRAFDEAGPASVIAMSDVDGLKALNEYGYEVGDSALRAKADVLRKAGLDAYHDKGDEFLYRAYDRAKLATMLERARAMLRDQAIIVEQPDGSTVRITGLDFSYGVGRDIAEAERGLRIHKARRERAGEISRGALRAIRVSRQKT